MFAQFAFNRAAEHGWAGIGPTMRCQALGDAGECSSGAEALGGANGAWSRYSGPTFLCPIGSASRLNAQANSL